MTENKIENTKIENKNTETKQEQGKIEEKKEEVKNEKKEISKKEEKKKIVKKEEAMAKGDNVGISKKHSMYICNFIKNKPIDQAIKELSEVVEMKRAIPFKGEIPHRKGDIMSGRYPVNAAKEFITILKGLKGNAVVNGLDLEKTRIYFGCPNWASRPRKSGGARFKRVHVVLKAKEIKVENKQEKKK